MRVIHSSAFSLCAACSLLFIANVDAAHSVETVYFDMPQQLLPSPIPTPTAQLSALMDYPDDANRLTLLGRVYVPAPNLHGNGPYPTILVMHGSGGMWSSDLITSGLISQFEEWGELLAGLGYLVCFPDSYNPRGIPGNFQGRRPHHDPLLDDSLCSPNYERPKDVIAALTYLQSRSDVDSENVALMGFSHGAQTAMNAVVDTSVDLGTYTVSYVAEGGDTLLEVDSPVRIGQELPFPKVAVFYYGGGSHYRYHGSANSTDAGRFMFDRRMKVLLFHGTEDSLMGVDDPNAVFPLTGNMYPIKQVLASTAQAQAEGVADPVQHHFIYDGVDHSFDLVSTAAEVDWDTNSETADQKAKRLSRDEVLKWFENYLKPRLSISIETGANPSNDINLNGFSTNSRLSYQWEVSDALGEDWTTFDDAFEGNGGNVVTETTIDQNTKRFFRVTSAPIEPPFGEVENLGFFLEYSDFSL